MLLPIFLRNEQPAIKPTSCPKTSYFMKFFSNVSNTNQTENLYSVIKYYVTLVKVAAFGNVTFF